MCDVTLRYVTSIDVQLEMQNKSIRFSGSSYLVRNLRVMYVYMNLQSSVLYGKNIRGEVALAASKKFPGSPCFPKKRGKGGI